VLMISGVEGGVAVVLGTAGGDAVGRSVLVGEADGIGTTVSVGVAGMVGDSVGGKLALTT